MTAEFHSDKDKAKEKLDKAEAAYQKVDNEYVAYKRTHLLPLDTSNPEVISLQGRRDEAEKVLEAAKSEYNKSN